MYIKKMSIKNFRAFDEDGITLQFNNGVNAIIGENNSGKSAVMDAIRIAYSTVTYKKISFLQELIFMLMKMEIQRSLLCLMFIWKRYQHD